MRERAGLKRLGAAIVDERFRKSEVQMQDYRGLLLKGLGRKRYDEAKKSYDLIGDTAVIDAKPGIDKRIGEAIRRVNRNVRRIVSKSGAVTGEFRTRKFRHVWGRRGYDVSYRENGITITTDLRKAFFSPRLAFERKRISDSAKDGEHVVVMFAGVGPFAILIGKEHPGSRVVAIELNRQGYEDMKRNVAINRTANVTPLLGDVRKFSRKYAGFADRIIMPLPKDAKSFLGVAAAMAGKNCVIHYYAFSDSRDPYTVPIGTITGFFARRRRKVRVLLKRIVRTYSPEEVEVVIDFSVS